MSSAMLSAITIGAIAGVAAGVALSRPITAAPSSSTTTTQVAALAQAMPPGFVAIGGDLHARVEWMYTRDQDLLVGIALAAPPDARSGLLPGTSGLGPSRRSLGSWEVSLSGGDRHFNTGEFFDIETPGHVTLEFAGIGATVADVTGISLFPAVGFGSRVHHLDVPLDNLPARLSELPRLEATELITATAEGAASTDLTWVQIGSLDLGWAGGGFRWEADPPGRVRLWVSAAATIEGDSTDPIQLVPAAELGAGFLQMEAPPASPRLSSSETLRKPAGAGSGTYQPSLASVDVTVSWMRPGADAILLPTEQAHLVGPIGD